MVAAFRLRAKVSREFDPQADVYWLSHGYLGDHGESSIPALLSRVGVRVLDIENVDRTVPERSYVLFVPPPALLESVIRASADGRAITALDSAVDSARGLLSSVGGPPRLLVVGFYDPLSARELSAPDDQARSAAATQLCNDRLRQLASDFNGRFCDVAHLFESRAMEFTRFADGIPLLPNANGVGVIAGLLWDVIERSGETSDAPTGAHTAEALYRRVRSLPTPV